MSRAVIYSRANVFHVQSSTLKIFLVLRLFLSNVSVYENESMFGET